ncbi:MAG: hypothetical protein HOA17_09205 [Candidatus Melainabacteria bacterium]|jgi:hypothetical protein|nr:hypothetical protein [Candidatus Melainabacteria bacterium]
MTLVSGDVNIIANLRDQGSVQRVVSLVRELDLDIDTRAILENTKTFDGKDHTSLRRSDFSRSGIEC